MNNIYGFIDPDSTPKPTLHLVNWECLGLYFSGRSEYTGWKLNVPMHTMVQFVRIDFTQINLKIARWFWDKVVWPQIPDHIAAKIKIDFDITGEMHYSIFPISRSRTADSWAPLDRWMTYTINEASFQGAPKPNSLLTMLRKDQQLPYQWVAMQTIDVREMCMENAFIALNMMRTIQDCPFIVRSTWALHQHFPDWSPFKCYLVACACSSTGEIHTMFYSGMFGRDSMPLFDTFSLKQRWIEMDKEHFSQLEHYCEKETKVYVEPYFTVGKPFVPCRNGEYYEQIRRVRDIPNLGSNMPHEMKYKYYVSPLIFNYSAMGAMCGTNGYIAQQFGIPIREAAEEEH